MLLVPGFSGDISNEIHNEFNIAFSSYEMKKILPVKAIQVTDEPGNNTKRIKKAHCVGSLEMYHEPCNVL